MSIDPRVAFRRLGLGARPGEAARLKSDPRGYVLGQLSDPRAALIEREGIEATTQILARQIAMRRETNIQRKAAAAAAAEQPAAVPSGGPPSAAAAGEPMTRSSATPAPATPAATPVVAPGVGALRREAYQEDAAARLERAIATETPLLERLTWFWSNHFTVSGLKGPIRGVVGAFEREAIRPHVLGRFRDMLRAVEQHPAMLVYLDNNVSIGPSSKAGQARKRGLNENLAREILELHTLGVDGGYSQDDVIALARMLTGWTVGGMGTPDQEDGRFAFAARQHEPGPHRLLGRFYGDGVGAGQAALDDLARHPSTARHLAGKLARHFLSDTPPATLVERIAKRFRDTEGDLGEVVKTLVSSDEVWREAPRKIVPPFDFLVALSRGLGVQTKPEEMLRLTRLLGQPLWHAPSPKGWPDDDDAWTAPSAIRERLRVAEKVSREATAVADPRALAEDLFAGGVAEPTRVAIARAETRQQGLQLLVMSPDFQRR